MNKKLLYVFLSTVLCLSGIMSACSSSPELPGGDSTVTPSDVTEVLTDSPGTETAGPVTETTEGNIPELPPQEQGAAPQSRSPGTFRAAAHSEAGQWWWDR